MKNFNEYIAIKNMSNSLYENNIDAEDFCKEVLAIVENYGLDALQEGWLDAAGRMASGAAGALGGMAKRFATGLSGAVGSAAQGIGQDYKRSSMDQNVNQINAHLSRLLSTLKAIGASDKSINYLDKMIKSYVANKVIGNRPMSNQPAQQQPQAQQAAPQQAAPQQAAQGGSNMRLVQDTDYQRRMGTY